MGTRKPPSPEQILDVLKQHGPGFPMLKDAAVTATRIHFATTDKKAREWLSDLAVQAEPILCEVWTSTYGFSSVVRLNTGRKLIETEPETRHVRTSFSSVGLRDSTIHVDEHARFVGKARGLDLPQRPWIMPLAMLNDLAEQQAQADREYVARSKERDAQENAAFEAAHPGVVEQLRAALTPIVKDFDRAVYKAVHKGSASRPQTTTISISLANEQIDAFAKLLSRGSETPSTEE